MKTRHIALIGMMCCGKSSVGRRMSEILGCPFSDLDIEIEKSTGKSISSIFGEVGEKGFRIIECDCLKNIHRQQFDSSEEQQVDSGFPAVPAHGGANHISTLQQVDGGFPAVPSGQAADDEHRSLHDEYTLISCGGGTPIFPESRKYLKDNFICIYLKTETTVIAERLEALNDGCATRPMLFGHDIGDRVKELAAKREEIYSDTADVVIKCKNKSIEEIAAESIEALRQFNFGLIGFPIKHSLSPALFNAAYGDKYSYELIECGEFRTGYELFRRKCRAVNVTAPFKADALEAADNPDLLSRLAEACNILVTDNDQILGYNSDVMAVQRLIKDENIETRHEGIETHHEVIGTRYESIGTHPASNSTACTGVKYSADQATEAVNQATDRAVLVIGCGGAGRAAAVASLTLGMRTIIINRSISKAESFAQSISEKFPEASNLVEVKSEESLSQSVAESGIIIFTLPCPMPTLNKILEDCSTDRKVVIEANYREPHLQGISGRHKYIGGKRWLELQAIEGYELMTGKKPDADAISNRTAKL